MASPANNGPATIVPAQLGFLAIFNPSLSTADDTLDDQIVYYASVNTRSQRKRHHSRAKPTQSISPEERNERLRQIGLAQGMVEFGRGFSDGHSVDTIDTEKSRVVLRELEPGWWILASIDLTKLPLPPRLGANSKDDDANNVEFSSREVKPAALLIQDLLRAHSIFLLHHAPSLSALFVRYKRPKFASLLNRYWDLFLSTWNVFLHGNPANAIYGGIKVAACGELGVGVGEEDRGSGEREVLEGFVGRTDGLVDLVVSKFGDVDPASTEEPPLESQPNDPEDPWLGTGAEPGGDDGAIFLGTGALSKKSVRDISFWVEDLYTWGEDAYGVKDSPASIRYQRKAARASANRDTKEGRGHKAPPAKADNGHKDYKATLAQVDNEPPEGGTTPLDRAAMASLKLRDDAAPEDSVTKVMNYLKMGYGTHWSLGSSTGPEKGTHEGASEEAGPREEASGARPPGAPRRMPSDDTGRYLIGLMGDVDEIASSDPDRSDSGHLENAEPAEWNSRVLLRTLTVELEGSRRSPAEIVHDLGSGNHELTTTRSGMKDATDPASHFDSQDRNKTERVRVVVYVCKPFIYTFLFQNRTDSLAWDGMYRWLHYQLAPLRKPLALSTTYRPDKPDVGPTSSNIFDLVWDPRALTLHSTIPSIPDISQSSSLWSRVEAISTHNQILNTHIATSADSSETERTCKTSRSWWIVWSRILDKDDPQTLTGSDKHSSGESALSSGASDGRVIPTLPQEGSTESGASSAPGPLLRLGPRVSKEIFLVRRAGEHSGSAGRSFAGGENSSGWADGASRLAQGIGVDTKKYIEGLLSLTR